MRKAAAGADSTNSGLQPAVGEPASGGGANEGGMVPQSETPPAVGGTGEAAAAQLDPAEATVRTTLQAAGNPDNR